MEQSPKPGEIVKRLSKFFKRDLITIPLIKKYPHQALTQRCGLKAATLELDTSPYPNIEYIAGNRLSVYPANPPDHVTTVLKHLVDDIYCKPQGADIHPAAKKVKLAEPWAEFIQAYGRDSLRLLLKHVYDITAAPSRQLLRIMAESCTSKEHKKRILAICSSDEAWERWICQSLRTMKSTFEEFNTCTLNAKTLLSELGLQQPRQYTISSIKSSRRFRTEIVVFQHKFTSKQIASHLQSIKEQDKIQEQEQGNQRIGNQNPNVQNKVANHVNHDNAEEPTSSNSVRSIRSVFAFNNTPITSQQVRKVPAYSGPLMSLYASSLLGSDKPSSAMSTTSVKSKSFGSRGKGRSGNSTEGQFDGLCSSYLLGLNSNEFIMCEFVENPRFTLKGNRERPIMMIGQDIGVVAFRAFWQQRTLEHDRAQVFYTLFKDLRAKRFGDMQLVCVTGNRCRVEDLFRREINAVVTNKILSSVTYINLNLLSTLLDLAAAASNSGMAQPSVKIASKELIDLGDRIAKLLVENNGCLYTCCDPQMSQAIEILIVESVIRRTKLPRENIMALLPQWKGRKHNNPPTSDETYLFKIENPFEGAQIVQEIYDFSI